MSVRVGTTSTSKQSSGRRSKLSTLSVRASRIAAAIYDNLTNEEWWPGILTAVDEQVIALANDTSHPRFVADQFGLKEILTRARIPEYTPEILGGISDQRGS